MFYEQIERRPALLLRLMLPLPIRAEGRKSEVGDVMTCHYSSGHLIKRVTQVIRGSAHIFEIVEQRLALGGGIEVLGGSYTLRRLADGGTELALTTRYSSPHRPRWLWTPIETLVCHTFHRHILNAMRDELVSR